MFFEDIKEAVDKNDWKTLGRDRKGRFTPRGGEDETKISRPNSQRAKSKQVKEKSFKKEEKKPVKKAKKPVSKKTEEKKITAKKEETKKLVKKVKSSYSNKGKKRDEEERKVNPIPKKNEIGTTMCDYLKKFQK